MSYVKGLPAVFLAGLSAVLLEDLPSFSMAGLSAVSLAGLSVVFVADWRAVLGKSSCWARDAHQSLSVIPMEPHGQALHKHGGYPLATLSFADSLSERWDLVARHPARHLPARALQWQAGRSRSGEAGGLIMVIPGPDLIYKQKFQKLIS